MRGQFLLGMLIATLLSACATRCLVSSDFNPRTDLVLPYHTELESLKAYSGPYLATFTKNEKRLLYVAADHVPSVEWSDPRQHPTMRTIESVFEIYKIDAVVVEGLNPWDGTTPPTNLLQHMANCSAIKFKGNCGENIYTLHLANQRGLSMISGEPPEDEIAKKIEAANFTKADLVGFYLLRIIPQWKRRGEFEPTKIEEMISDQLSKYRKRVSLQEPFTIDDFKSWYRAKMGEQKPYLDFVANDTAPHGGVGATFVQRISHQVGLVRDRAIVENIAKMLNQHDTVLVVYGGSHLIVQHPALKEMMPTYSATKLF